MHLLFVDDEISVRRLGGRILVKLGATVTLLDDGDRLEAALRDAPLPVHAVLMDIIMERSDGVSVCTAVRRAGFTRLPIIVMSGTATIDDLAKFQAAGFDVVLPKPFDARTLLRAVEEAKERRGRQVEAELGGL